MARICLWTEPDTNPVSMPFRTPDGAVESLTNDRLYCTVFAGGDPADQRAIVDTGAPSTIFPYRVWRRFAGQIEWLNFASGASMRRGTIAGKEYHFRLGRVSVRLAGRTEEPTLAPVLVVAQFEQFDPSKTDNERLTEPVVGLQFGPLEGRYLIVSPQRTHPDRCEVWVTDERPVDPLVLTSSML
ncbi:MAG: hypothetical protein MUF18_02900 [Fimbriiglobus sp.]|jgi:hypothetical protein|nr:hypothetical protein [Fimbriiglobus sp.]